MQIIASYANISLVFLNYLNYFYSRQLNLKIHCSKITSDFFNWVCSERKKYLYRKDFYEKTLFENKY